MLQVFYIDVYTLLHLIATLCFVNFLVEMMFYVLPNVLIKPFSVTTLLGDSVVAK